MMQIVIDIPDDIYQKIEERRADVYYDYRLPLWVLHMIDKGTPLPKGHGVLKDVTNLMRGIYTDMQTDEMMFTSSEVYKLIDEECPTIIPAEEVEE